MKSKEHGEHAGHDHAGDDMMAMPSSVDLNDPMNRESSGTAWVPDSTPMYAKMKMRGRDMLMLHGSLFPRYTHVGSDRDVSAAGKGGHNKLDAPSMFMVMYSHPLDARPQPQSQLGLRLMMSADPFIERGYGYPLLYQSGESYKGVALHDRQHPHDLFDELSATYSRRLGRGHSACLYVGYPGEPALGPPTFMHRAAAMDSPDAPISHHWQDSTHITFGVATLGFSTGKVKLEGSAFNGREPDENRYDFDEPRLNSASARLSWNPNANLAMQVSHGYLKNPEVLHPGNVHRTTASLIYNKPLGADANWSSSLVWGQNKGHDKTNSYLFETNYQKGVNTIYARLERVQKSGEELVLSPADEDEIFNVGAYSLGYVRDLRHGSGLDVGLGAQVTLNTNPGGLDPYYGSGSHGAFQVFLRIRPSRLKHGEAPAMESSPMHTEAAASGIKVAATIAPTSPKVGKNTMTLTVTGASGKPVSGAKITANVGMTNMDMGTTHPTFKELGNGRYAGDVAFSMAGPWRVTLRIATPQDTAPITKDFDYNVRE